MVPNAPKWYERHQNMSLGSKGVDRVRSLRNDSTRLRGTNFCTSSERFAPSFIWQINGPKCTQMVRNKSLGSNGVDRVRLLRKILTRLRGTHFCTNCTSSARFAPSFTAVIKKIPNAPEHYETHQNMSFGSHGFNRVHSLRKI